MNKSVIAILAMAFGMASISAHAMENHQHCQQKAAPSMKAAQLESLGGSGKACKDGKCGSQNKEMSGMGGCCCANMMSRNMGMKCDQGGMAMNQDNAGGMDQAAMMERMRMMEERMEMMQKMMMEQKARS